MLQFIHTLSNIHIPYHLFDLTLSLISHFHHSHLSYPTSTIQSSTLYLITCHFRFPSVSCTSFYTNSPCLTSRVDVVLVVDAFLFLLFFGASASRFLVPLASSPPSTSFGASVSENDAPGCCATFGGDVDGVLFGAATGDHARESVTVIKNGINGATFWKKIRFKL